MPAPRSRTSANAAATDVLTVRLDAESRACLPEAAGRRGITLSDYVRAAPAQLTESQRSLGTFMRGDS